MWMIWDCLLIEWLNACTDNVYMLTIGLSLLCQHNILGRGHTHTQARIPTIRTGSILRNQAHAGHRPARTWFNKFGESNRMFMSIIKELLETKMAECNTICQTSNWWWLWMQQCSFSKSVSDNIDLNHTKYTHLSATIWIVDIIITDTVG